jgi:dTDP-4-dehydrorhamnose reductase
LHERLLGDWAAGKTPRLYVDEIRQVCHADNLALALIELAGRADLHGVFHWAGAESLSRHELGLRIRANFGLDEKRAPLLAVRRADDPAAAAVRQADLTLDLEPLASALSVKPETFDAQLAQMSVPPALRGWLDRE